MQRAISAGIVFRLTGSRGPSSIVSKYRVGKMAEETLMLTPFEGLFLFFKGKIEPENPFYTDSLNLMRELLPEPSDLILYSVYEKVKLKGLQVKREKDSLFFRKSPRDEYSGPLRVIRESSSLSFRELIGMEGSLVAAVDDENDITFFRVEGSDPKGDNMFAGNIQADFPRISDRSALVGDDVPGWIGNRFRNVRFLTEMEECLLREASGESDACSGNPLYRIYSDLVARGLIVKTGFKYGTNFRAYTGDMESHADYLIHFLSGSEEWYKISRAVRVAHGVHKTMVFAGPDNNSTKYVAVQRLREPFL